MNLQDVKTPATRNKRKRRIGRGQGSGWGCTAGRGNKGQGSRAGGKKGRAFEGGQMPLARRLPKRGFTNALFKTTFSIVNVGDLVKAFPDGGAVDLEAVKAVALVKHKAQRLKILAKGDLEGKTYQVKVHKISDAAKAKIEAAGGSVEIVPEERPAPTESKSEGKGRRKRKKSSDGSEAESSS